MAGLRAVLFDMDGTLTRPDLDFAELRRRVGAPAGRDIIGHIQSLPAPQAQQALATVEEMEMESARRAQANPGVAVLACLRDRGLRLGLVTNNHRRALDHTLERLGLRFDLTLSREDARPKPAPDLICLALERLGCSPAETRFVGDGAYDRQASAAAGVAYIHLAHDGRARPGEETLFSLEELPARLGSV